MIKIPPNFNLSEIDKNSEASINYWNVVKGIGIISVVIGHTAGPLVYFVYLFHLAVFFFVSGYFYNHKYSFRIFLLKKIKALWLPFFCYGLVFVLVHNLLIHAHLIIQREYTGRIMFISILDLFRFVNSEQLLAAIWFLASLFFSLIIYDTIRRLTNYFQLNKKIFLMSVYIVILPIVAYFLLLYYISYIYLFDIIEFSLILTPIIFIGNIASLYKKEVTLKFSLFIISFIILLILTILGVRIEIVTRTLPIFPFFYIISIIGIYFVLALAKYALYYKRLSSILILCGKYSLHIMVLHFLSFKLINLLDIYINSKPIETLAQFPYSNPNYWILYSLAGVAMPIIGITTYKRIIEKAKIYFVK